MLEGGMTSARRLRGPALSGEKKTSQTVHNIDVYKGTGGEGAEKRTNIKENKGTVVVGGEAFLWAKDKLIFYKGKKFSVVKFKGKIL